MEEPLQLEWQYCLFNDSFKILSKRISGVYVIWEGEQRRSLYIGRGNIAEHISNHLSNKNEPIFHASRERTWVAYAKVAEEKQAGVENFLIQHFEPTYGQIEVNLPSFPSFL